MPWPSGEDGVSCEPQNLGAEQRNLDFWTLNDAVPPSAVWSFTSSLPKHACVSQLLEASTQDRPTPLHRHSGQCF